MGMLPPAVVEPDKVYGRIAAAEYAGISVSTLKLWQSGRPAYGARPEIEPVLLWGVDFGPIDYGYRKYDGRGELIHHVSTKFVWYRKTSLDFFCARARRNELLRRHGYSKMMSEDFEDPERRDQTVLRLMDLEGIESFAVPLPPKITRDPDSGLYLAPNVVKFGSESGDTLASRKLALRLRTEAAEREARLAERERGALERELAGFSEKERGVIIALVDPALRPQPSDVAAPPTTPAVIPAPAPTTPAARRTARAAEIRAAQKRADEAHAARMAAWRARTGYPGVATPDDESQAS